MFPAIAVSEELTSGAESIQVAYAASERGIDREILSRYPEMTWYLPSSSPRQIWRHPFQTLRDTRRSYAAASHVIQEFDPQVVVGCGGFASVPVVVAAIRQRIPVVLLEQNLIPGRANVWLSRWASSVCLSFEETRDWFPKSVVRCPNVIHVTGNPVRRALQTARPELRQPNHLLVLGGSQGAHHLNQAVAHWVNSRPAELAGWTITHQTGVSDHPTIQSQYDSVADFCSARAEAFLAEPDSAYRAASLVVARAGATSLAEMACLGTPMILVPLPSAARDHQTSNAQWYKDQDAADVVIQSASPHETAVALHRAFVTRMNRREHTTGLRVARPDAAACVANVIRQFLKGDAS